MAESASRRIAFDNRPIDSSRSLATSGSITLSWKLPDAPAIEIAAWWPITCAQTMQVASGITGLTLPGMIELPGCSAGSSISPRPASGPEFIQRRSLETFISATASALSWPESSTASSCEAMPSNLSAADSNFALHSTDSAFAIALPKRGSALMPVPIAVPPMGSRRMRLDASRMRASADASCAAQAPNSWAKVSGIASIRCVRPVLTTPRSDSRLALDRLAQVLQRRQQVLVHGEFGADADRGRDHVVGTLAEVDVVVRVHLRLSGARGEVRDHLVRVHVARGAGAGLVHVDGKMRVVVAVRHFQRRLADRRGLRLRQQPEAGVDLGRGGLDQAQRADEAARHRPAGDREVLHRALGLRAPQRVGGHPQLAHAVVFDAEGLLALAGHRHP